MAQKSLSDREIETITSALIVQIQPNMRLKNVAVTDFVDLDGNPNQLGKYLSEEFSFALTNAQKSFSVIDRSKLRYLFREDSLANMGLISPESIVEISPKLKGIDALVYGTVSDVGDNMRVIVKLLRVETAELLATSRGDLTKTPSIRQQMANEPAKSQKSTGGTTKMDARKATAATTKPSGTALFRKDNLQFELLQCRLAGQLMDCSMQVTNQGDDMDLTVYRDNSRAILSPSGNERTLTTIRLADKSNSYQVGKTIVGGATIKATATFGSMAGQPEAISKLELNCWTQESGGFMVEFRNIQIEK